MDAICCVPRWTGMYQQLRRLVHYPETPWPSVNTGYSRRHGAEIFTARYYLCAYCSIRPCTDQATFSPESIPASGKRESR